MRGNRANDAYINDRVWAALTSGRLAVGLEMNQIKLFSAVKSMSMNEQRESYYLRGHGESEFLKYMKIPEIIYYLSLNI
jgi:Zn-finger domain-containing protein